MFQYDWDGLIKAPAALLHTPEDCTSYTWTLSLSQSVSRSLGARLPEEFSGASTPLRDTPLQTSGWLFNSGVQLPGDRLNRLLRLMFEANVVPGGLAS